MNLFRQIHMDFAPPNRCFCESAHDSWYFCTECYRISSALVASHRSSCGVIEECRAVVLHAIYEWRDGSHREQISWRWNEQPFQ
jgi:hypothetical protein